MRETTIYFLTTNDELPLRFDRIPRVEFHLRTEAHPCDFGVSKSCLPGDGLRLNGPSSRSGIQGIPSSAVDSVKHLTRTVKTVPFQDHAVRMSAVAEFCRPKPTGCGRWGPGGIQSAGFVPNTAKHDCTRDDLCGSA